MARKAPGSTYLRLSKDITEDADKGSDEEVHRARSGRVVSAGGPEPVKSGCVVLLVCGCVHQPSRKLSEPHTPLGFFTGASSHRHGQLYTPFPACLPSLENRGGTKTSRLLITAWPSGRPLPLLGLRVPQSHLIGAVSTPGAPTP